MIGAFFNYYINKQYLEWFVMIVVKSFIFYAKNVIIKKLYKKGLVNEKLSCNYIAFANAASGGLRWSNGNCSGRENN